MIQRLRANHPTLIDLSTGRVERLLATLGRPDLKLPPVIHVAGTNGKGSTVAYLRAIAEAQGLKAHVLTSPHLVRFSERIRVAGEGDPEHLAALALVPLRAAMHARARGHDGGGLGQHALDREAVAEGERQELDHDP